MKTIIAGMRDFHHYPTLLAAIQKCPWNIDHVVSGGATGVDSMGQLWAQESEIPCQLFPVTREQWNEFGKKAGPMRNRQMAENAEALLAIWDGKSKGTKNMIETATAKGLHVHVYRAQP
jgi:hypothetical protein